MGRRKQGPRRLKPDGPYYAVLHVLPKDRPQVGKVRLIRSLKTHDHTEALRRYGGVLRDLEQELNDLISPQTLKTRVEALRGDTQLSHIELTEVIVGKIDPDNQTHEAVYKSISTNQPLPITWEESLALWEKSANRTRTQAVAPSTVWKYNQAVKHFEPYCAYPYLLTKTIIREFLQAYEEDYVETTVAARYRYLRAVFQVLIENDKVDIPNHFDAVKYTASVPLERQRRPFTDDEICIAYKHHPEIYHMITTGLRAGEYFSRLPQDINGQILRVDKQPSVENWRPKTLSSVRSLAVPTGFTLLKDQHMIQSNISRVGVDWRKYVTDPTAPVHSARHTYITLARRVGMDSSVLTALTGHASKENSRVAQAYGLFPDEVLIREAQKVWDLVERIVA